MTDYDKLIEQLNQLTTEEINPNTTDIDHLPPIEIARKINAEDRTVPSVVELALGPIAEAAQIFAQTLRNGGRVFYIGAGTSGRLGVLDAAECPPTFGTDPGQTVGVISGGYDTLVLSREGVEDDRNAAVDDLKALKLDRSDMLIGLAASVRTPYTRAGLEYARQVGCRTVFIFCNAIPDPSAQADIMISLPVGPEVITGSTRMKAGTAQKLTLNMISTTGMILLGKTYGNLMVDLQARSEKLAARSRKILMELLKIDLPAAEELLKRAEGSVKTAIVIHQHSCTKSEAVAKLADAGGFIRNCQ